MFSKYETNYYYNLNIFNYLELANSQFFIFQFIYRITKQISGIRMSTKFNLNKFQEMANTN